MSKVSFKGGLVFTQKRNSRSATGNTAINTLEDALSEQAQCSPCGCDSCKGYETVTSAETGELLVRYYIGPEGGPYEEVIEPYDVGMENINALYEAR